MHIFLLGAAGFVGERTLDALLAAGHDVTAHTHTERSQRMLQRIFRQTHPKLSVVVGAVATASDMFGAIPEGTDVVIYLPGLLREFPKKGATFCRVHVEGVRNTIAAAKLKGVQRWIQLSALGVQPKADTEYFRTKYEAEELVRASGMEWTILRPSFIFDNRPSLRHNFVGDIAKAIRMAPFVPILGRGDFMVQPVALDDVVQSTLQSLSNPKTYRKIFELGGPEKMSYRAVAQIIARAIGTKKPIASIPFPLIIPLARILGGFHWFPITVEQIAMLRNGNYVRDPAKELEVESAFHLSRIRFSEEAIAALVG